MHLDIAIHEVCCNPVLSVTLDMSVMEVLTQALPRMVQLGNYALQVGIVSLGPLNQYHVLLVDIQTLQEQQMIKTVANVTRDIIVKMQVNQNQTDRALQAIIVKVHLKLQLLVLPTSVISPQKDHPHNSNV